MSKNPNNYKKQKIRGLKRKYEAIQSKGGKCQKCGYNTNISALEFHHRDPTNKKFQIDVRAFSNKNIDLLLDEINKCDLLCANCHRELHNPDSNVDTLIIEVKKCNDMSFNNRFGRVCPVCGKRFNKNHGIKYCSKICRENDKKYPSIDEITNQYEILKSWEKVAFHFGLTRSIIQGIRKNNTK